MSSLIFIVDSGFLFPVVLGFIIASTPALQSLQPPPLTYYLLSSTYSQSANSLKAAVTLSSRIKPSRRLWRCGRGIGLAEYTSPLRSALVLEHLSLPTKLRDTQGDLRDHHLELRLHLIPPTEFALDNLLP